MAHKDCPFCDRKKWEKRVFYEDKKWAAFLAAPFHTEGHTILIRKKEGNGECPEELNEDVLSGMGCAIAKVSKILMDYKAPKHGYKIPKRILFASLRGDEGHFHVHLIPLWEDEEKEWRLEQIRNNHLCYEKGHLIEYLGHLEKEGDKRACEERTKEGWTSKKQREEIEKDEDFNKVLNALQINTGYNPPKKPLKL